jgi:hypothetical protein
MHRLKTIDVYIGKPYGIDIELPIGFIVTSNGIVKIDLFLLSNKHSRYTNTQYFIYNAPFICQKVVEIVGLHKLIQDIEWTYTASIATSNLKFKALNVFAVKMIFENGVVAKNYCGGESQEYYEEALNDPRGLTEYLQRGLSEEFPTISEPIEFYLAHTPRRIKRIHVLEPPYTYPSIDEHPVVVVDTNAFISYWEQQCKLEKIGVIKRLFSKTTRRSSIDDDLELLNSSIEKSLEQFIPCEMSCGVKLCNEKIRFTNGRHRFVNLAKAGASFIPVQTEKYGLEAFRELFEWKPAKQNPSIYK